MDTTKRTLPQTALSDISSPGSKIYENSLPGIGYCEISQSDSEFDEISVPEPDFSEILEYLGSYMRDLGNVKSPNLTVGL